METSAFKTMLPDESLTVPVTVARSPWPYAIAVNNADVTSMRLQKSNEVDIFDLLRILVDRHYISIFRASILRKHGKDL
jgi:hypothetical protein